MLSFTPTHTHTHTRVYPKDSGLGHNEITTNTCGEATQRIMAAKTH